MSDGAERGPIQKCFDWHQSEQAQRAGLAAEHAAQCGAGGVAVRLIYHLFAYGSILVKDEERYSVLEASVRELATALECSVSTAWQATQYWIRPGVLAVRMVTGRSEWLLSWSAFWAFGRVRSRSVAFGRVRSCSVAPHREGKPRMIGDPMGTPDDSLVLSSSSTTTTAERTEHVAELLKILRAGRVRLNGDMRHFVARVAMLRACCRPNEWIDAATRAVRARAAVEPLHNPAGFWRACLANKLADDRGISESQGKTILTELLAHARHAAHWEELVETLLADQAAKNRREADRQRDEFVPRPQPSAPEVAEVKSITAECRQIVRKGKMQ